MKFRLSEGGGECFYYLGVEDDGYPRGLQHEELQESMAIIHRMAASLQVSPAAAFLASRQQQGLLTCFTAGMGCALACLSKLTLWSGHIPGERALLHG